MTTRKWLAVAGMAAVSLWFASPARAEGNPRKCFAPTVPSAERIAGCTAMIEAGTPAKPILAAAYRTRACAYLEIRDLDHAIADYTEVIQRSPEDRSAYIDRGGAYYAKKDFENAIADCTRAIQLNPRDIRAYLDRGIAFAAKRDADRAIADYDEVIRLSPKYKEAYLGRGGAYLVKRDLDRAIADYIAEAQLAA